MGVKGAHVKWRGIELPHHLLKHMLGQTQDSSVLNILSNVDSGDHSYLPRGKHSEPLYKQRSQDCAPRAS